MQIPNIFHVLRPRFLYSKKTHIMLKTSGTDLIDQEMEIDHFVKNIHINHEGDDGEGYDDVTMHASVNRLHLTSHPDDT